MSSSCIRAYVDTRQKSIGVMQARMLSELWVSRFETLQQMSAKPAEHAIDTFLGPDARQMSTSVKFASQIANSLQTDLTAEMHADKLKRHE